MRPLLKTKILPSPCGCCGLGTYPKFKRWANRRLRHTLRRLLRKESA